MSILEAMYQGCNVIAFHAPGPDTIIEDGISGHLVSGLDEMKELITSHKICDAHNIKERVETSFTWDYTAACFDEWIREAY
jgi:1,2-diacylglycerol 3-alpha-glucosyltransferase